MAEAFVALREVVVRHGDSVALEIPALELIRGQVLALIGPNGAGKSTLLRVMGLLQPPTGGRVFFQGENAFGPNLARLRRRTATVFQEPLLLNATVYDNAALGLKLRRVRGNEIEKRVAPWLERLGIAGLRTRSARTLSGGEAQRTSLARAFVLEPEILLLDEPFGALDPATRKSLLRDFQRIVEETGITTVFVTHDCNEAYALAGRIGVLKDGRLIQIGAREDVFFRPASDAVAAIVGVENCLPGVAESFDGEFSIIRVQRNRITVRGKFVPGTKVMLCLRPEEVILGRAGCERNDANRLTGIITGIWPGMMHMRMTLDCGGVRLLALVDRKHCLDLALSPDDEIGATFGLAAAHVIVTD